MVKYRKIKAKTTGYLRKKFQGMSRNCKLLAQKSQAKMKNDELQVQKSKGLKLLAQNS